MRETQRHNARPELGGLSCVQSALHGAMETTPWDRPMQHGPDKTETLFLATVKFPRDPPVLPRVLPGELEADRKQTGSLNDRESQGRLCLYRKRRAGGQEADSFPLPLTRAGESDRRT